MLISFISNHLKSKQLDKSKINVTATPWHASSTRAEFWVSDHFIVWLYEVPETIIKTILISIKIKLHGLYLSIISSLLRHNNMDTPGQLFRSQQRNLKRNQSQLSMLLCSFLCSNICSFSGSENFSIFWVIREFYRQNIFPESVWDGR